jgi:isopenicillin-N N-acyltransferase-like protein
VNKTMHVSRQKALAVARASIPYAADYSPDMMDEIAGMAEASGVPLVELMLLQVRNQLREEGGCTSFALAAGECLGDDERPLGGIVAQNWDNDLALDEFTVVLTRRPTGKPATMNVTQAGLIAYIGFSEAGIGACLNTLPAPSREVGVPHYFTLRGIYEARSRDEAAAAVRRARRAIPANIMLITPQGPADLEITPDDVHVLTDEQVGESRHVDESLRDSSRLRETRPRAEMRSRGRLTHTNHCLHACLVQHNQQFPELIQSHPRKRRIDELLGAARPLRLQQVQDALRDHEDHPRSICRHANEDPATGFWETVFSVIIEPSAGRMHVTRGTPCAQPYETYVL